MDGWPSPTGLVHPQVMERGGTNDGEVRTIDCEVQDEAEHERRGHHQ